MLKHYELSFAEMDQIKEQFGERRYSPKANWFDFFVGKKVEDDKEYAYVGHVIILKIDDGFECIFGYYKRKKHADAERIAFYDFATPTLDGLLVILQILFDKHGLK